MKKVVFLLIISTLFNVVKASYKNRDSKILNILLNQLYNDLDYVYVNGETPLYNKMSKNLKKRFFGKFA